MEKRLRRLEIAVITLGLMLVVTFSVSVYCAIQMETLVAKVPSYTEIKEDIKTLNKMYKISEDKLPKAYNYTKEKVGNGYDTLVVKGSHLIEYLKKKTK